MHKQSTNHISVKKGRLRCYAKSSTAQDVFQPGLISFVGVTGRSELLSYAQNAVKWLALSKRPIETPQKHSLFIQLSFVQLFFVQRSYIPVVRMITPSLQWFEDSNISRTLTYSKRHTYMYTSFSFTGHNDLVQFGSGNKAATSVCVYLPKHTMAAFAPR